MNEMLLNVVDPLHQWFLGLGALGVVLWIVLKILVIAMPVIIAVAFYVVWERKLIGWMHVRHGPMYVGMGIFQAFADVFKLLFKEIIQPSSSHKAMFVIAPLIPWRRPSPPGRWCRSTPSWCCPTPTPACCICWR